jgi:hypothetical protein
VTGHTRRKLSHLILPGAFLFLGTHVGANLFIYKFPNVKDDGYDEHHQSHFE